MLIIAAILLALFLLAVFYVIRQTRAAAAPDVAPMKAALERRLREGAEFRL